MKNIALSIIVGLTALALVGCKMPAGHGGGGSCHGEACEMYRLTNLSEDFSQRFELNSDASFKLAQVYVAVDAGDFSSLETLGFSQKDLEAMAHGQNPTTASLQNVAQYLQISLGEAHGLIQKIKSDLR